MGEGASHVVIFAASGFHKLLEFGDDLFPAAVTGIVHTETVMDFLPTVQTENHIAALPVGPFNHIVIHKHAVGGQGEAEILIVLLFHRAGVGNKILDDLEVHQRLTAKKVHFQIAAAAGILNQKIQSTLAHFKAHYCPVAVIFTLAGKAVGAVQVAGVSNV